MKETFLIVLVLILCGCGQEKIPDGQLILEKTILEHDPLHQWDKTKLHIHVQEPRVSNPHRYSILNLDNSNTTFRLARNRDQYLSEHSINRDGNSFVLLDGKAEIDSVLIAKYRLDATRNFGYRNFYRLLYGLPMSLSTTLKKVINTSESVFNKEDCYKIQIELKEPVISKSWNLYVSKSTMRIRGIEILVPEKASGGERLYFDELVIINGIKIPRIRHWHELNNDMYSGSDIIIQEIPD